VVASIIKKKTMLRRGDGPSYGARPRDRLGRGDLRGKGKSVTISQHPRGEPISLSLQEKEIGSGGVVAPYKKEAAVARKSRDSGVSWKKTTFTYS